MTQCFHKRLCRSLLSPSPATALCAGFLALAFLVSTPSWAYDADCKGLLGTGLDIGYAVRPTESIVTPSAVHGGVGRLRLFYALTNWVGLEASGAATLYGGYVPGAEVAVIDAMGITTKELHALPRVTRLRSRDLHLGMVYFVDLLRLMPSLGIGVVATRLSWLTPEFLYRVYDVGLRVALHVDWRVTSFFWAGVGAESTIPLSRKAPYGATTGFVVRLTYLFRLL